MQLSQASYKPGTVAQLAAPVARTWQRVQNGVANLLGLKNANTASAVVGVVWLTTMAVSSILVPIGPAVYGAGLFVAGVGGAGLVENHVTNEIAKSDGRV